MKIPTYEEQMNLVSQGYAKKSSDGRFDTFKYARKVMYKYLWDELKPQGILECRGHVYDTQTKELVSLPIPKSFNYLELNTWKDVPLSQHVVAFKKFNGYMVAATIYKGEVVVSTTGTTTSNYATYAKELIDGNHYLNEGTTTLFECVADWDKHIVDEPEGLHLLGARNKHTGMWVPVVNDQTLFLTLGELLDLARADKGEGWMAYSADSRGFINTENFCKIKTDYYVGKKMLMRMKEVGSIWADSRSVENRLPDRWKHAVVAIKDNYSCAWWAARDAQMRREFLETIEKE